MKQNGASPSSDTGYKASSSTADNYTTETKESVKDGIESLFETAGDYIETRIDLYKLKAVDKTSDIISSIASKVIVFMALFLFLIVINIAIGLLLGDLLGKNYYGFFLLAAIYLVVGLIFNSQQKKWFKDPISNTFIKKLF